MEIDGTLVEGRALAAEDDLGAHCALHRVFST